MQTCINPIEVERLSGLLDSTMFSGELRDKSNADMAVELTTIANTLPDATHADRKRHLVMQEAINRFAASDDEGDDSPPAFEPAYAIRLQRRARGLATEFRDVAVLLDRLAEGREVQMTRVALRDYRDALCAVAGDRQVIWDLLGE